MNARYLNPRQRHKLAMVKAWRQLGQPVVHATEETPFFPLVLQVLRDEQRLAEEFLIQLKEQDAAMLAGRQWWLDYKHRHIRETLKVLRTCYPRIVGEKKREYEVRFKALRNSWAHLDETHYAVPPADQRDDRKARFQRWT